MEGVLLLAHGSSSHPRPRLLVERRAREIESRGVAAEVGVGFLKESPSIESALAALEADVIYALPYFISEGYYTERVLPERLGIDPLPVEQWHQSGSVGQQVAVGDGHQTVVYSRPVGTQSVMASIIEDQVQALPVTDPVTVVLVGHGTDEHAGSGDMVTAQAQRIDNKTNWTVTTRYLDQEPTVDTLPKGIDTKTMVIVPAFVADGYHVRDTLAEAIGCGPAEGPDAHLESHRVWWTRSIGEHPAVTDVLVDQIDVARSGVDRE